MVLTFIGRSLEDPTCEDCCCPWDLLTKSLLDLEAEDTNMLTNMRWFQGLVKEADIDSFHMPYYTPYKDEMESIIQKEGSFSINRLEVFEETLVDVMKHNENDREYMSEKNTIIAIFAAKGMS
ncbi:unnamed protein product [Ilex paraguariensis]|uniref:Uncharacterized protein n=1 Tax=Ilex paraguariensis TaxID=185542 RepID=A0ABC8RJU2_9AQUA